MLAASLPAVVSNAGAGAAVSPSATPTATVTGSVTLNGAPFNGGKVPFGSLVDLVSGAITLKTGVGTLQVTRVSARITAAFVLRFIHVDGKPYVQLELAKGDFSVCPKRPKRKTYGVTAANKTVVRGLWGNGKGNFQTRGRFAAATVRGTHWQTDDRCDGTWLKVVTGVVAMTSLKTGATTSVRAGQTHLVFAS